jgi:hypothetical protein
MKPLGREKRIERAKQRLLEHDIMKYLETTDTDMSLSDLDVIRHVIVMACSRCKVRKMMLGIEDAP